MNMKSNKILLPQVNENRVDKFLIYTGASLAWLVILFYIALAIAFLIRMEQFG